eukprot:5586894-Heterocapsa_arctica.AAC.1
MLSEINCTTKANIIQSILGLGHVVRQQRHPELTDLPDIVNFLEAELRFFNMRLCTKPEGNIRRPGTMYRRTTRS